MLAVPPQPMQTNRHRVSRNLVPRIRLSRDLDDGDAISNTLFGLQFALLRTGDILYVFRRGIRDTNGLRDHPSCDSRGDPGRSIGHDPYRPDGLRPADLLLH